MFLAPWFLLGLAAAAIPLVLHLRRARQVRKISFSTTRFFDEDFMRAARRARFQDLLLMLLRIALFCLFALALARPLLRFPGLAGLGVGRRHVALVLDNSASMGVVTDRGTLLDRARASALAVLDELSTARGDRATVVLAGRRDAGPVVLFDEPSDDIEAVKQAVRDVHLTDLATDVDAAVRSAGKALGADPEDPGAAGAGKGAALEVYVFSDLQAGAFAAGAGPELGAGVGLLLVAVRPGADAGQNVSVDAVQYGSPRPVLGVPFTFRALITNHGDRPSRRRLNLVVDDQVVGHDEVDLEPGRGTAVRFVHRFTDAGWRRGRIELEPAADGSADPLPVDDRRYFAVRVEQTVRILAVNGAPSQIAAKDELFFFRLALTAVPELPSAESGGRRVQIEQISAGELSAARLARFPVVVLANVADLSADKLQMIEHYVDGGGNLLISLGDRVDAQAYNKWIGPGRLHGGLLPGPLRVLIRSSSAETELTADASADNEAAFVAAVDLAHPALAGFGDAQLGYLSAVRLEAWYGFDAPPAAVLMRTSTGQPLLAEKGFGRGRVLLFASTLDRDWTNFPLQPTFVPWVYRLVSYLAQPAADRSGFVSTGQVVRLPVSTTAGQSLLVARPDGGRVYPEPAAQGGENPRLPPGAIAPGGSTSAGSAVVLADTDQAGIYAVRRGDAQDDAEPRLLLAANLSRHESDPSYLDEAGCRTLMGADALWVYVGDPDAVAEVAEVARRGYGLWDYLLVLALLVGLFEPWVANRLTRRRGGPAADALDRRSTAAMGRPATDGATEAA